MPNVVGALGALAQAASASPQVQPVDEVTTYGSVPQDEQPITSDYMAHKSDTIPQPAQPAYCVVAARNVQDQLKSNGVDARIATVLRPDGEQHAVVTYNQDGNTYVRDPMYHGDRPIYWRDLPYTWQQIQGPNGSWQSLTPPSPSSSGALFRQYNPVSHQ